MKQHLSRQDYYFFLVILAYINEYNLLNEIEFFACDSFIMSHITNKCLHWTHCCAKKKWLIISICVESEFKSQSVFGNHFLLHFNLFENSKPIEVMLINAIALMFSVYADTNNRTCYCSVWTFIAILLTC